METYEYITLTNNGNAPAKFSWNHELKIFSVDP